MPSASSTNLPTLDKLERGLLNALKKRTGKTYFVSSLVRRKKSKEFQSNVKTAIVKAVKALPDSVYKDSVAALAKVDAGDAAKVRAILEKEYGSVGNFMDTTGITDFLKGVYNTTGQHNLDQFNFAGNFDLRDQGIIDRLASRSDLLIQSVDDTTKDNLANIISRGVADSKNWAEIASEIRQTYPDIADYRAELIARTEIANASGQATKDFYQESGFSEKRWVLGAEGCPICQENADAGWIPIDDSFPSGDDTYPAHPNCLCDTESKAPDDYIENGGEPWLGGGPDPVDTWLPSMDSSTASDWAGQSDITKTLYHGTTEASADSIYNNGFALGNTTVNTPYSEKSFAVFLTPDKTMAQEYAQLAADNAEKLGNDGATATVVPVKINIKNPAPYELYHTMLEDESAAAKAAIKDVASIDINHASTEELIDWDKKVSEQLSLTEKAVKAVPAKVVKELIEKGYDSIYIPKGADVFDGDVYAVFDKYQVVAIKK